MPSSCVWENLTRYLLKHRDGIIEQFAAVARLEPKIESADRLAKEDVIDHLPKLLDSFAEDLRAPEGAERPCKAAEFAREHGRHRWEQHYRIDEVIREYAILRQILMFQIEQFEKHQIFESEDRLSAARTLHDLIDEVMLVSVSEFADYIAKAGRMRKEELIG
jgi:hypothetical protein